MDLDTLAKLGEFVGGFFVVLSLVYLAHQVRMNTKSLRSENYARVLERMFQRDSTGAIFNGSHIADLVTHLQREWASPRERKQEYGNCGQHSSESNKKVR